MGGKTSTTTQKVTIPKEVMARYNAVNARAENVASTPFQQYSTDPSDFVAQLNAQQYQGIDAVNNAAGAYRPYFDQAASTFAQGLKSAQPQALNLEQFLNPYQSQVIDATMKQMGQANEQAQSGALGTAISSGAFGGDRAGIAAANLANQQGLAMGSTLAGLNAQNYNQALQAAQQQQGLYLGATQADLERMMQGGQFYAGLGTAAQQAGLQGAEAQINAGTLAQQTEQAGKSALYNQFQQQQAYPFQVAQFLANIAMGTGALSGSTTTTTQPSSFWSDRRLKEDIQRIGHTDDGLPIYKYKYKGDDNHQTHIGFMADEVEQHKPEAVGVAGNGYKYVDYDRATKAEGGGVAGPYGAAFGSQNPYAAGYVPQATLPVGELMVADPSALQNAEQTMAQQLEAMNRFGETVSGLKDKYDAARKWWNGDDPDTTSQRDHDRLANWRGGVAGYAFGGAAQDAAYLKGGLGTDQNPVDKRSYLSDTVDNQEESKKNAGLSAPSSTPNAPQSTMGKIGEAAETAMAVAKLFAMSDRRMKHSIRRIGHTDHGMPIYSFKYKGDDREQTHIGFMADEVERDHPDAVMTGHDGMKRVDYGQAHKFYQGGVVRHGYATSGAVDTDDQDMGTDLGSAIRALGNDAVGYGAGKVDPRLASAAGLGSAQLPAPSAAPKPSVTLPTPHASQLPDGGVVPAIPAPPAPAAGVGLSNDAVAAVANSAINRSAPVEVPAAGGVRGPQTDTGRVARDSYDAVVPVQKQLDFITYELQKPEYSPYLRNDYRTAGEAAVAFDKIYERSGGAGNDVAAANANDIYAAAQAGDMTGLPQNVQSAYQHFVASGMTPIQAAGATGRLMVESYGHMDPNARNTIGGGMGTYGFAQWRGDRLRELAEFSGVPLEAITGAPVSTPEGRYYASSAGGVGAGQTVASAGDRGGVAAGYGIGGDKPYAERSRLGQMFYDEDGRVNKDALLSILSGIGTMASSPSRYLGASILQGIGGAANTYMAREQQRQDITSKSMANANAFLSQYERAKALGYVGTPQQYADAIGYTGPVSSADGVGAGAKGSINSYSGVPLDAFGRGMNMPTTISVNGKPVEVMAGQTYGYLKALEAKLTSDVALGIQGADQTLAQVQTALANHKGQIVLADGRTVVTDPTYEGAAFGATSLAGDLDQTAELRKAISSDLLAAQEGQRNAAELGKALSMLPSTGNLSGWFSTYSNIGQQLGLNVDTDAATGYEVASKVIAGSARDAVTSLAGKVDTNTLDGLIRATTPNPDMSPAAIEELLAIQSGIADYNLALANAKMEAQRLGQTNLAEVEREFTTQNRPADFIDARRDDFKGTIKRPAAAASGDVAEGSTSVDGQNRPIVYRNGKWELQ